MSNVRRHKALLKILTERERATVEELVEELHASVATIRRDITSLAQRGLLHRLRGGAERLAGRPRYALAGGTFDQYLAVFPHEKRAIAQHAAGMCQDGDTITISSGTTTFMMVEFLVERRMRILTNSFLMAEQLLTRSLNEIIVPGGLIYREQNVILSPFENDVTQNHYASKMFLGAAGLTEIGLLARDPLVIQAERRLINQANKLVVLADSSKFLSSGAGLILCPLQKLHCVITDDRVSEASVRMLEGAGVKVITVSPEAS
jgi:DeoR family ulaG and ulaABCDEF operon transcriptional repressor